MYIYIYICLHFFILALLKKLLVLLRAFQVEQLRKCCGISAFYCIRFLYHLLKKNSIYSIQTKKDRNINSTNNKNNNVFHETRPTDTCIRKRERACTSQRASVCTHSHKRAFLLYKKICVSYIFIRFFHTFL